MILPLPLDTLANSLAPRHLPSTKHDIPSAGQSESRILTRYPKWLGQWSAPVEVSGLIRLDYEQQSLPTRNQ